MATDRRPEYQAANLQERAKRGALFWRRREELGYTGGPGRGRPAFERDTGIHRRTSADLEKGYRVNFKVDTLNHIARAYRVTYDSAVAVLRGQADELIPAETAAPPAAGSGGLGLPPMPDPHPGIWPHVRAISNRLFDLAEAHGVHAGEVRGHLLFPGDPVNAARWDDEGLRRAFSVSDRIYIIAEVLRSEADASRSSRAG